MAAAHLWGYQLYRRQFIPVARVARTPDADSAGTLNYAGPSATPVRGSISIGFIIIQQLIAALLGSTILDGGIIFGLCLVTIGVYWFMFALGAALRRRPTTADRMLLNIGLWPLLFIIGFLAHLVWLIKGLI